MKTTQKNSVKEFIYRNTPKQLRNNMEALSTLKYPIQDKYSFECALESCDEDSKIALSGAFRAVDFPLATMESGLEKFIDRFQPFPFPIPRIPDFRFELPDRRETPSACEVINDAYPGPAGNCGCRAFVQALRNGSNQWQAIIIGIGAARSFLATGTCPV